LNFLIIFTRNEKLPIESKISLTSTHSFISWLKAPKNADLFCLFYSLKNSFKGFYSIIKNLHFIMGLNKKKAVGFDQCGKFYIVAIRILVSFSELFKIL